MHAPRRWWVGAVVAATACLPVAAETPRAELGKRLRRFELAWQEADGPQRAAAVPPMTAAVRSFFSMALPDAARRLDEAWYVVRGDAPGAAEREAVAVAVTVTPLLADTAADALSLTFAPCYDAPVSGDDDSSLRLVVENATGAVLAERLGPWSDAQGALSWACGGLPEGDHTLVVERVAGPRRHAVARIGISRARDLHARLDRITTAAETADDSTPTVRATLDALAGLLAALADSDGQETDYPAARLLQCAEALAADGSAAAIARAAVAGDLWLTLSDGRGGVPVRLRAPEALDGPLPVLVLFHGAGGSENMFFETCGAGRAVTLGRERGWLVVAPRQGLFGMSLDLPAMLDALEQSFPIDRSRVFLVGHSMGAGQVSRQVAAAPDAVAAAVALGGGAGAPVGEAARGVPWFVGAGEADFGRRGAEALATRLAAGGVRVEQREYPAVEHMVVVQAALDDVFAFLDRAAADRGPRP